MTCSITKPGGGNSLPNPGPLKTIKMENKKMTWKQNKLRDEQREFNALMNAIIVMGGAGIILYLIYRVFH